MLESHIKLFQHTYQLKRSIVGSTADGKKQWEIVRLDPDLPVFEPAIVCCIGDTAIIATSIGGPYSNRFDPPWLAFSVAEECKISFPPLSKWPKKELYVIYDVGDTSQPVAAIRETGNSYLIYKWNTNTYTFDLLIKQSVTDHHLECTGLSGSASNDTLMLNWSLLERNPIKNVELGCEVEIVDLTTGDSKYLVSKESDNGVFGSDMYLMEAPKRWTLPRSETIDATILRPFTDDSPMLIGLNYHPPIDESTDPSNLNGFVVLELPPDMDRLTMMPFPEKLAAGIYRSELLCNVYDTESRSVYLGLGCHVTTSTKTPELGDLTVIYRYSDNDGWEKLFSEPRECNYIYRTITSMKSVNDELYWVLICQSAPDCFGPSEVKHLDPSTGIVTDIDGVLSGNSLYVLPTNQN